MAEHDDKFFRFPSIWGRKGYDVEEKKVKLRRTKRKRKKVQSSSGMKKRNISRQKTITSSRIKETMPRRYGLVLNLSACLPSYSVLGTFLMSTRLTLEFNQDQYLIMAGPNMPWKVRVSTAFPYWTYARTHARLKLGNIILYKKNILLWQVFTQLLECLESPIFHTIVYCVKER